VSPLDALAQRGITGVASTITDTAEWCRDWAIQTGDARYFVIAEMLRAVDDWWDDESGGAPDQAIEEIDALVIHQAPGILDEADPATGTRLANSLRLDVLQLLLPPSAWAGRGWAN
jgi:hypothetical protein